MKALISSSEASSGKAVTWEPSPVLEVLPVLEELTDFSAPAIHDALFARIGELGVKNGWLLYPLRVAVSGKQFTPGGGVELCAVLGKEESLKRVRDAVQKLERG